MKRYRDHYRHPAYSRPPALAVASLTTSKRLIESSNTSTLKNWKGTTASAIQKTLPLPVGMSSVCRTRDRLLGGSKPSQIARAKSNPTLRPKNMFKVANPILKPTRIARSATSTHIFHAAVPVPITRPRHPQLSSKAEQAQVVQREEVSSAPCKGRLRSKSTSSYKL